MSTIDAVSSANGPRLPSASLRLRPCPEIDSACVCIQSWKSARVLGSNAPRISSSSTVSDTCEAGSDPSSGDCGAERLPGVSSTNVSPSSVFWRRIARASRGSGE